MARKHPLVCRPGEKRYTVLRVDGDDSDAHAGRNFEKALRYAQPDRGSRVDVFVTCAFNTAEARMPYNYKTRGRLVKTFRAKRG
jgi:hypothetical protein